MTMRRVVRTRQPQQSVGIDWSNPLARDLLAAFLPVGASMRDAVTGLSTVPTSASRSVATQAGMALTNDLASNSGQVPFDARLAPASAITILFYGRTLTSGTYNAATEVSVNGWGAYGTGPNVYLRVGSAWADINTGGAAGDIACWGFTFDGSTFRAVRNGRIVGSQAISGTITHSNAGIMFGGTPQNPSLNGNSACARLLIFGRALSADELRRDYANPWQLFQPIRQPIFVSISAGGGGEGGDIYRPGSDISVAGWAATPGGTLASCIDETAASDADFITSPNLTTPAVMGLSAPMPAGSYTVRVRAARTAGQGQVRVRFLDTGNVDQGGTAWQALTSDPTTYELPVTTTGSADRFRIEVQP
jgi:hypothetical protein